LACWCNTLHSRPSLVAGRVAVAGMAILLLVTACQVTTDGNYRIPFIYHLQNANYQSLVQSNPALAIVDADDSQLTSQQIGLLQQGTPKQPRMQLYAYISMGEVDLSRHDGILGWEFGYPKPLILAIGHAMSDKRINRAELNAIITAHDALPKEQQWPSWITDLWRKAYKMKRYDVPFNMEWNTLRVAFWRVDYQAMRLRQIKQMLDQGYDGIYLDTIDSFEALEQLYSRQKLMKLMVNTIYLVKHQTDANLIVNNAMELYDLHESFSGDERPYASFISGQLKENTWYDKEGSINRHEAPWQPYDLQYMENAIAQGIPVYCVDYFKPGNRQAMMNFLETTRSFHAYGYAAPYTLNRVYSENASYYQRLPAQARAKLFKAMQPREIKFKPLQENVAQP